MAAIAVLSESCFMHIFTESVGVPLRPYILWLRLQRAVGEIMKGATVTQAAHQAGLMFLTISRKRATALGRDMHSSPRIEGTCAITKNPPETSSAAARAANRMGIKHREGAEHNQARPGEIERATSGRPRGRAPHGRDLLAKVRDFEAPAYRIFHWSPL